MPKRSCAPPQATRNEITSSKISTIPRRWVSSRSHGRNPSAGGTRPALQSSGSTIRPATWSPSRARISAHASWSFHGSTTVCLSTAGGMPDDQATGFGRFRLPAVFGSGVTLTITQSCVPWKAPSNLASFGRPVKARARRTAFIVDSVPELVKRTLSSDGMRRVSISASRTSCSVGPGKDRPFSETACTALMTSGCAWPRTRLV